MTGSARLRTVGSRPRAGSFIVIAVVALALAACGNGSGGSPEGQSAPKGNAVALPDLPAIFAKDPGYQGLQRSLQAGEPCAAVVVGGFLLPTTVAGGTFGEDTSGSRQLLSWLIGGAVLSAPSVPADLRPDVELLTRTWVGLARDLKDHDLADFVAGTPAASKAFFDAFAVVDKKVDLLAQDAASRNIDAYLRHNCEPLLRSLSVWDQFKDAPEPDPKREKPATPLRFASAGQLAESLGCKTSFQTAKPPAVMRGVTDFGSCNGRFATVAIIIFQSSTDATATADREKGLGCPAKTPDALARGDTWVVVPDGPDSAVMAEFTVSRLGGDMVTRTCAATAGGSGGPATTAGAAACSLRVGARSFVLTLHGTPACKEASQLFEKFLVDPASIRPWTCFEPPTAKNTWICEGATRAETFSAKPAA